MSRILFLSIALVSLSSVVGCGASRASQSTATPVNANVAEARDEACWHPPGEIAMSINDAKASEAASAATPATDDKMKSSSYRPNRQDRPTSGAVHAATY